MLDRKLLYLPVIIMILLFLSASTLFSSTISSLFSNFVSRELKTQLESVIDNLKVNEPKVNFNDIKLYIDRVPFKVRKQQFTLIDSTGKVWGDSSMEIPEIKMLNNHKNIPEFINAN